MADLPTVLGPAGLLPQPPQVIHDQIAADAVKRSPGLVNDLPGLLLEDVLSTDVAAIVVADQARVDLVNSVTPFGANAFLLQQLGENVYGVPVLAPANTSVLVVVTGPAGYVVPVGFQVTDGTYGYAARDGGIVGSGGQTAPLYFAALESGAWAVPPGTVTQISSSFPASVDLSCSNPYAGTPGLLSVSESEYRTRVLRAGRAAALGTPSYVRTQVTNVPGVQERLVAVQQPVGGGLKILAGGGDPYAVAFAIYSSVLDVTTLVGSVMGVGNVTRGPDAVISTTLNHGYVDGQVVTVSGVQGMPPLNGVPLTVRVIDEKTFATGVDTSLFGTYAGGGVLSPNARNQAVTVADYPDTYEVRYVAPPQQLVTMTVLWNTTVTNYVNDGAVEQLAAPALAAYVNAVYVGQPLNVLEMDCAFRDAVASVLPSRLLVRLIFEVSINGVAAAPATGETIIAGDFESWMYADPEGVGINVTRG